VDAENCSLEAPVNTGLEEHLETVTSDNSIRSSFRLPTRRSATPTVRILAKFLVWDLLKPATVSTLVLDRNNIHSIRRSTCNLCVLPLLTFLVLTDCIPVT
jgi:hypothetical protein